jgi:hypothetical protein
MSERRIDEQLKRYYGERVMSPEAIARIRSNANAAVARPKRAQSRWRLLAVAAAVVVAIVAGVVFVQQSRTDVSPGEVAGAAGDPAMMIAHALVDRHENCEGADFTGDSLADVLAQMTELGFEAVLPEDSELQGARFVSAHYCTVDGMRALHAFYTDEHGERLSLFEAPLPPGGGMMDPGMSQEVGGYLVTLTARDGLMVAFTRATI